MTQKTTPDNGTVKYIYDKMGNLRYSQDANQAQRSEYSFVDYDYAGRPTNSGKASLSGISFENLTPIGGYAKWQPSSPKPEVKNYMWYDQVPRWLPGNSAWTKLHTDTLKSKLHKILNNPKGQLVASAYNIEGNMWQVELYSYDK